MARLRLRQETRPAKERQDFVWDKIVLREPGQTERHPAGARQVQAAGHLDNRTEATSAGSSRRTRAAAAIASPNRIDGRAVLQVRLQPGEAVALIEEPTRPGWWWRGVELHVGSQCTNFEKFLCRRSPWAGRRAAGGAVARLQPEHLDIGRWLPRALQPPRAPFSQLAKVINAEIDRYFRRAMEIIAEPGRFFVATAVTSIAKVIGKAVRDGRPCYTWTTASTHLLRASFFRPLPRTTSSRSGRGRPKCPPCFGQRCGRVDTISTRPQVVPEHGGHFRRPSERLEVVRAVVEDDAREGVVDAVVHVIAGPGRRARPCRSPLRSTSPPWPRKNRPGSAMIPCSSEVAIDLGVDHLRELAERAHVGL